MDNSKIHEALMAVQSELKAPKGQMNKFGGYKYRSCEDILEAVKPILKAHSLVLRLSDKPVIVDSWHYIEATATVESQDGATYTVTAYAREPEFKKGMDDSQITGTASSYARKYALNGLFCIDDTKDADTDEYQKQTTSRANKPAQKQTEMETIPPMRLLRKAVAVYSVQQPHRIADGNRKKHEETLWARPVLGLCSETAEGGLNNAQLYRNSGASGSHTRS